jgi:hypothetical protein
MCRVDICACTLARANSVKALITLGEPRVQRGPRTVDAPELGFDGLDLCLEDHRLGLELGLGRFLEEAELIAGYRIDIRGMQRVKVRSHLRRSCAARLVVRIFCFSNVGAFFFPRA